MWLFLVNGERIQWNFNSEDRVWSQIHNLKIEKEHNVWWWERRAIKLDCEAELIAIENHRENCVGETNEIFLCLFVCLLHFFFFFLFFFWIKFNLWNFFFGCGFSTFAPLHPLQFDLCRLFIEKKSFTSNRKQNKYGG